MWAPSFLALCWPSLPSSAMFQRNQFLAESMGTVVFAIVIVLQAGTVWGQWGIWVLGRAGGWEWKQKQ